MHIILAGLTIAEDESGYYNENEFKDKHVHVHVHVHESLLEHVPTHVYDYNDYNADMNPSRG